MNLSIGEVCRQTGLSADTLRYYERIGLLGRIARNGGGQRRYDDQDVARLQFVRRAQTMDFSLHEIGQLLALRNQGGDVRADVRALTENKLSAIGQRIEALTRLRDELSELVRRCHASAGDCPIIARMDKPQESDHELHGCC